MAYLQWHYICIDIFTLTGVLKLNILPLHTCDYGRGYQGGIWRVDLERTNEVPAVLFTVGLQHVIIEHQGVISCNVSTKS